ncbi:UDP-N-acetylglucosamine--dolichyl-phosphate N-acetylglucosaminephosphotransferase [Nematocida sp. LUAm2]|nr:UDP-N-acetylglucosamine--dolichyl-phosphate N-acetylglucosaminephosphotransferase [Nematocida sp. LUAm2]
MITERIGRIYNRINWETMENIAQEGRNRWVYGVPFVFGVLSYRITWFFMKNTRVFGEDVHKKEKVRIPEGTGIGSGMCFVCAIFTLGMIFQEKKEILLITASTIIMNILLGYVDDTMELNWRSKLIFPCISLVPLILTYTGSTSVSIPFWKCVDLSGWFYVALIGLSIFFTNAINILSGINGVETGQVAVISLFMGVDRMIFGGPDNMMVVLCFSLFTCTFGLFLWNRYPAKCFVGDTFCYFSGSAVLCLGIIGGFTKTVIFFFIPQFINFMLSVPQLFGIIPCPRHRMPGSQEVNGKWLLVPSTTYMPDAQNKRKDKAQKIGIPQKIKEVLKKPVISFLRKAKIIRKTKENEEYIANITLLNLLLLWNGPMHEKKLFNILMYIQASVCVSVILAKIFFYE